jgi:hypothetical protein
MPMFCTNAVLDAVIVCLLGLKVLELLCTPAVQKVPANYDPVTNLCWLFAGLGNGPMSVIGISLRPAAIHRSHPDSHDRGGQVARSPGALSQLRSSGGWPIDQLKAVSHGTAVAA